MDYIFSKAKYRNNLLVYLDDILVFTKTLEEHREVVKEVLEILEKNNLCIKLDKCEFEKDEIEFLGFIVGGGMVKMDPGKVKAVKEWKSPKNKKELQSFLGFANFYRKFIKDFAEDSLAITPLTGKKEWKWEEKQEKAFRSLIDKMCKEPILYTIKDEGKLKIEVDGSGYAMGVVLMQEQEGQWRTVTHMSETYNEAERNYHTGDREMLAIMKALKKWRQYLVGSGQFEIWTDHRNLTYFQKPQNLNRRQAGWVNKMQDYDFTIHHIEGKKNIRADILSRREGEENQKDDNKNIMVLPAEVFRRVIGLEEYKEKRKIDKSQAESWMKEFHDSPLAGHPGVKRMKKLMEKVVSWEGMNEDIEKYVEGCQECQKNKPDQRKQAAPLHPLPIAMHPWE
jgi:RNase H-like domain found in reverse transcriptase/Integrase zinc binding domain/Reverse transcriptase (RNA-dependent DNA polymerase)